MKTIIILVSLMILNMGIANTRKVTLLEKEQVAKYQKNEHPSISLPTNFGKEFILSKNDIELLSQNEIYQIDLIYTQFKSSPAFDQEKLNQNRINQLSKLLPQLNQDNPNWNLIEQTGAKDKSLAKTYFHGFEIYYKPKNLDASSLPDFFSNFEKPTKTYTIQAEQGATVNYSSGTTIHIPKNAVVDKNGKTITGTYQLSYTEYRNPAEIALSGIPMKYLEDGENKNFTSKGMYEIRGAQNGSEVFLKKPIIVDFNCTSNIKNTGFFALDDKTQKWNKLKNLAQQKKQKLNVNNDSEINVENEILEVAAVVQKKPNLFSQEVSSTEGKAIIKYDQTLTKKACVQLNAKALKEYIKRDYNHDFNSYKIEKGGKNCTLLVENDTVDAFVSDLLNVAVIRMKEVEFEIVNNMDWGNANGTLLASGADKGHSYPNLVKGLNSESFGVYNCDQLYRMKESTTIHPKFVNESTNKKIEKQHVACVMDLNYNGSFSFDPKYITISKAGNNALLLFTEDKKVFISMPEEMATNNYSNKKLTINMKEITDQMKTSEDLKKLLNI